MHRSNDFLLMFVRVLGYNFFNFSQITELVTCFYFCLFYCSCSVACFKKHKESLCQKSETPVKQATATNELTPPPTNLPDKEIKSNVEVNLRSREVIEVEEERWIVSKEQFSSLAECKELRDALKSEELKKLILRIDSSEEPEQELDKAMGGQFFHEFTEKILDIFSQKDG
ncbi:HIT-type Zinc finger family protein [Rhynchospora pubera]|uniref:HIT-type Zinc finger family protein n=1 Tax=Rhynchospora pubera TaxID=906938 RepID=A0AAV8DKP6_9POAL|nr:HIT-type Zinc finger family protein [Rhynchospora pubera]